MDVAKEIRAEADRLHRIARDIESSKPEGSGFKIQVLNPDGKIEVEWAVTKLERVGADKAVRYVAGWRGGDAIYARVAGIGAGVL